MAISLILFIIAASINLGFSIMGKNTSAVCGWVCALILAISQMIG